MSDPYDREREAQTLYDALDYGDTLLDSIRAALDRAYDAGWRVGSGNRETLAEMEVERLKAQLALVLSALPDSETAGPDGTGYQYAWDELTGDEQEWVKGIRAQVRTLQGAS